MGGGWVGGQDMYVCIHTTTIVSHSQSIHTRAPKPTWAMKEGRPSSSMFLQRQMALKRSRHSTARAPASAPAVVGSSKAWRMKSEKSL